MSPKLSTPQPKHKPYQLSPEDLGKPPEERQFWVRVLVPGNCVGLPPGYSLQLHEDDERVRVLNGVALLGELEQAGVAWVRAHGHSACVFVGYDRNPQKRFRVRITAR